MQTLKVKQTLLQAGLLHSNLEMGHLLHTQAQWKLLTGKQFVYPGHTDSPSQPRESDHQIYSTIFVRVVETIPTLRLSGKLSSRRLSFSLLLIMLTVSSTFGLVLLLLLSCCSSVPVSAASLWSTLFLHVSADGLKPPCRLRLLSSDCLSFSSKRRQQLRKIWRHENRDHVNLKCLFWFSGKHIGIVAIAFY